MLLGRSDARGGTLRVCAARPDASPRALGGGLEDSCRFFVGAWRTGLGGGSEGARSLPLACPPVEATTRSASSATRFAVS